MRGVAVVLAGLLLPACAAVPEDPDAYAAYKEANDPFEPTNRVIFQFNRGLDALIFKPLAQAYVTVVPEPGRRSLRNVLNNLRSPVILANDILQAEISRAGVTIGRFLINSTLGLAGLFDVADDFGLPFHDEDFGQTLAVWGVPEGPFIMLPVFGPSNPRDAIGKAVDTFFDPLWYVFDHNDIEYAALIRSMVDGIDRRAQVLDLLDEIERTSLDFYATIRSLYRQRREDEINNGVLRPGVPESTILSEEDFEDFYEEEFASESPRP